MAGESGIDPELGQGLAGLGLHRAHRAAESPRHLCLGQVVPIAQDDDGSLSTGEPSDGGPEVNSLVSADLDLGSVQDVVRRLSRLERRRHQETYVVARVRRTYGSGSPSIRGHAT